MIIKTENLKLAEVRYFDVERNGLEFTPPLSHVVLLNRGDTYVSLLNADTHMLISIINETNNYEEFLSRVKERLNMLEISEDDFATLEKDVQKKLDETSAKIDSLMDAKEKEIMQV